MASNVAWKALLGRIGADEVTKREFELQGLKSIDDLADLTEDDIKSVVVNIQKYPHPGNTLADADDKPYLNAVTIEKLKVVRFWVDLRKRTGQPFNSGSCTNAEITLARLR